MFSSGDLVWVNLGLSYGWWPATFQEESAIGEGRAFVAAPIKYENATKGSSLANQVASGHESRHATSDKKSSLYVKFFDDESKEFSPVSNPKYLEPYLSKNRLKYIRAGLKRHSESKGRSLDGGTNLKLAQLTTDIEMAEVLSGSCDIKVTNLLMKIAQQLEDQQQQEEEQQQQQQQQKELKQEEVQQKQQQEEKQRLEKREKNKVSAAAMSKAAQGKKSSKKTVSKKENAKESLNKVKAGKVGKQTTTNHRRSNRVLESKN